MIKQQLNSLLICSLLSLSSGCSNGSSTALNNIISSTTGLAFTPSVYVECESDVNPNCTQTNRNLRCTGAQAELQVFAVITKNSCSNISTDYLAKGSDNLMCTNWGCTGGVLRLTNSNNQIIDEMPAGNANLCVYLDLSCDGQLSSQDLFQQRVINVHDDLGEVEILDWIQL